MDGGSGFPRVVGFQLEPAAHEVDGLGAGEFVPEAVGGLDEEVPPFRLDFGGGDDRFGGEVGRGEQGFTELGAGEAVAGGFLQGAGPFPAAVAEGAGYCQAEQAAVFEHVRFVGVLAVQAGLLRWAVARLVFREGDGFPCAGCVAAAEDCARVACAGYLQDLGVAVVVG